MGEGIVDGPPVVWLEAVFGSIGISKSVVAIGIAAIACVAAVRCCRCLIGLRL